MNTAATIAPGTPQHVRALQRANEVRRAQAQGGVGQRRWLCAHRSTLNSFGAEALFGALVCTPIGRGGSAEQQLWPI